MGKHTLQTTISMQIFLVIKVCLLEYVPSFYSHCLSFFNISPQLAQNSTVNSFLVAQNVIGTAFSDSQVILCLAESGVITVRTTHRERERKIRRENFFLTLYLEQFYLFYYKRAIF